jgi:hypothetical protein
MIFQQPALTTSSQSVLPNGVFIHKSLLYALQATWNVNYHSIFRMGAGLEAFSHRPTDVASPQ